MEKRDYKISEGKEVEMETASASNVQGPEYRVVVDLDLETEGKARLSRPMPQSENDAGT